MSNSTRDQEITRRRLAGEAPGDLAREFDISPERVWQIVSAAQRSSAASRPQRRRASAKPERAGVRRGAPVGKRSPGSQWWECVGAAG